LAGGACYEGADFLILCCIALHSVTPERLAKARLGIGFASHNGLVGRMRRGLGRVLQAPFFSILCYIALHFVAGEQTGVAGIASGCG
jgi:hypothetical protein